MKLYTIALIVVLSLVSLLIDAKSIPNKRQVDIPLDHGKHFARLLDLNELLKIVEDDLDFLNLLKRNEPVSHKRAATAKALSPTVARSIYNIPGDANAGAGKTVAIVVAYGGSSTESDLATFSSRFSLPSCTTANGCFKKVNQTGGSTIPGDDPATPVSNSWSGETNLDVQWVHSVAPQAKIVLVCANSPYGNDMYAAVKTAATLSSIVSMSWGGAEGTSVSTLSENIFVNGFYNGVSFFASTGDDGKNAGYPASSPNVVAVGGTTTYYNSDNSFASESAWSGSSGGCSAVYSMTNAQTANAKATSLCGSKRATPDISFDADPNSGAPIYLQGSWYQFGGTSLACPIAAARAAAVKAASASVGVIDSKYVYSKVQVRDVSSGSNQQYSASAGYDLPTGLGVWIGDVSSAPPTSTSYTSVAASTTRTSVVASTTRTTAAAPPSTTKCTGLLCL